MMIKFSGSLRVWCWGAMGAIEGCRQTSDTGHFSPLEYVPGSVHRVGGLRESRSSERVL